MEKQRSFGLKPSRFLLFTFTTFSSVIIFIFFSIWISIRQETHPQFINSSPNLEPVIVHSLTDFSTNFSTNRVEDAILADAPFKKPQNTSGVNANSDLNGQQSGDVNSIVIEDEQTLIRNFTADGGEDSDLASNPFERSENATGVSPISEFEESEELEDEAGTDGDDEDLASLPELSNRVTEPSSVDKIEVPSSVDKIEVPSSVIEAVEKKNNTDPSVIEAVEKKNNTDPILESAVRNNVVIEKRRKYNCDITKGKWVYDENYPLYTSVSCPFIDEGFSCQSNGRQDKDYMKWKWKPEDCDIPRFDAKQMLESLRGKRLVFVGDSINRNQWESMLCMLMQAVEDPNRVYETHGRRITKEKGNYCFKFVDYKCTVEYYVSHFLVHESKALIGKKRKPTLRIDAIDRGSSRWRGADILIFNTAHWWSHSKTKSGINYYQDKDQVHRKLDVSIAFRRALMTWASWVDRYINKRKTQVFFRSSSPSHFSGGQWNSGGHCTEATRPLNLSLASGYPEKNVIVEDVVKQMKTRVTILNITGLSGYRIDGHPSVYGRKPENKYSSRVQDCSHWCLPGVPDIWNELLYFHLQSKLTNSLL